MGIKRRALLIFGLFTGILEAAYGQTALATLSPTRKDETCEEPKPELPSRLFVQVKKQQHDDKGCFKMDYAHQVVHLNLEGIVRFEAEYNGETISMSGKEIFDALKS